MNFLYVKLVKTMIYVYGEEVVYRDVADFQNLLIKCNLQECIKGGNISRRKGGRDWRQIDVKRQDEKKMQMHMLKG